MAYKGIGSVGSCCSVFVECFLDCIVVFYYINWRPLKVFSKESFQRLFFFWIKTVIFKAYSRFIL